MLNSCITLRFDDSSFMKVLLIDFKATNFEESLCMAKLTLPKAPLPITLPILYHSTYVSGALPVLAKAILTCFCIFATILLRGERFD